MTIHGGDVWQVAADFGILVRDLLDFSANINPRGLPERARQRLAADASDPCLLGFYPDPSARPLRQALSDKLDVPPDTIVIGAGAEALLSPILSSIAPRRALIPVPAFSEYRRVCEAWKIEIAPFALDPSDFFQVPVDRFCESINPGDVVFLNHPHNPSGAILDPAGLHRIFDIALSRRATLLLDEAFIDYLPHASLVREAAAHPGLIVLRSLTKFYGCPSLRIGYAVAHPETASRIRFLLPTWPITQFAIDALAESVGDREYEEISLRENIIEREHLASSLRELGFFVFPSAANYLLLGLPAETPSASELRTRLIANHRILIRNCDSYEGLAHGRYIRVAVRGRQDNLRLIQALQSDLR
jgi:threonine-phosphate decarboxylase